MSECYINDATGPCHCDGGCDWKGDASDLAIIQDIEQRLTPGSIVPAGECPKCGALAYQDTPEYDPVAAAVTPLVAALRSAADQCKAEREAVKSGTRATFSAGYVAALLSAIENNARAAITRDGRA